MLSKLTFRTTLSYTSTRHSALVFETNEISNQLPTTAFYEYQKHSLNKTKCLKVLQKIAQNFFNRTTRSQFCYSVINVTVARVNSTPTNVHLRFTIQAEHYFLSEPRVPRVRSHRTRTVLIYAALFRAPSSPTARESVADILINCTKRRVKRV